MFEYVFLVTVFLVAGTMYGMYLYFSDRLDECHTKSVNIIQMFDPIIRESRSRFEALERSIREKDEHWSICLGNAKQSINEDLAAIGRDILNLEERLLKKMLHNKYGTEKGNIEVIIPNLKEDKRDGRKRTAK